MRLHDATWEAMRHQGRKEAAGSDGGSDEGTRRRDEEVQVMIRRSGGGWEPVEEDKV